MVEVSIIKTENLTFAYKEKPVIDKMNLSVKKGEFIAVLGRNGSGKSTLAKHFNALNLPMGGKVYVCGFDTEKNPFEVRACAGMVFQNPDNQMVAALVEDEVAFAPENLGIEPQEIRSRVTEALNAVELMGYEHREAANLSGGEKQRLAIAGVLAMKPEIIILDEATAMLDPKGRQDVMNTILHLNESGTTVVHITHHMDEAVKAKRVIVTDNGKVILDGTPKEVFADYEAIKNAGLEAVPMMRLARELRKNGIDISSDILTVEEMYTALLKIKSE